MTEKISQWFLKSLENNKKNAEQNLKVLDESWEDPKMIGRENDVKVITSFITDCISKNANHLIFTGDEGSGKTFCINTIISSLSESMQSLNSRLIYLQPYKFAPRFFWDRISSETGIDKKGMTTEEFIREISRSNIFIIVDNIEKIQRLNDFFNKIILNLYETENIHLILITSNFELLKRCFLKYISDIDYKKYFRFYNLDKYSEDQLYSILENRVINANLDREIFAGWILRAITERIICYENCNLHYALHVLRESIKEKSKSSLSISQIIENIYNNLRFNSFQNLDSFNFSDDQVKIIFDIICDLKKLKPMSRTALYDLYRSKSKNPYTDIWFHKVLHKLEDANLIQFVQGTKNNWRLKYIGILVDPIVLKEYIKKISK